MAKIDNEHQVFIQLTENHDYMNFVKEFAPEYRLQFKENLATDEAFKNKKIVSFVDWAFRMSEKEYYLTPFPLDDSVFSLTNKDFGSMVNFRYCTTLTEATKKILKVYKEAIEIVQLHSKFKGSGSKIINEFIKLSMEIQLPLVLYTETESLVKYYEQYNFKNYGQQGNSNEYLMIRIPESNH